MFLTLVVSGKCMFLNLKQSMVSRSANVCMTVLCHFGPKWELVLFLIGIVLRVVVYMAV